MKWILPLSILVFFEMVADIFAKNWSLRGGWYLAGLSLLSYMLANVFWLFALKNGSGLTKGAIIFSISSAVVATILGVFFYKEDLSIIQMIGVFLGLVSLIFIFWE
jgi:drug/metabolite transporter (DMT)-like permease